MAKKLQTAKPPAEARDPLPERVLGRIRRAKMVRAGDRVAVAVSGGSDSVALLLLLEELREKLGIVLSVVHLNHQLRGRASDADEKFVAGLAAARGLAFHLERAKVGAEAKRTHTNIEEMARRFRYEFFERLVRERRVDRVAVAHTADDQAETVLAHILRGTGLAGLGGIHPAVNHAVRPLLDVRRAELRRYLKERKQPWREDVTNRDVTRLRARIRKTLLPLLEKKFQPAVVKHLSALAELAREDEAFLDAVAEQSAAALAAESGTGVRISANDLLRPWKERKLGAAGRTGEEKDRSDAARALSKRVIRKIVERVKRRPGQMNAQHVDSVLELARHGRSGSVLQLPGGVEVERDLDDLLLRPQAGATSGRAGNEAAGRTFEYAVKLDEHGACVAVAELGCVFRLRVIDWPPKRRETMEGAAVLDRKRLLEPLVLRSWRPGDAYRPAGHQRPHKLKRLFLERRISRRERMAWPVLTSGGVIAWARGFPVAADFVPDARTQAGIVIAEEGK
jgi:tRNA(Ile)-lysidine synthase